MHGVSVTVISFVRERPEGDGHRLGDRQRHHAGPGRRPGPGRRRRRPRRRRPPRTPTSWSGDRVSADWDDAPVPTDIHVYDAFAPALGEAFGRAAGGGPGALRLRQPRARPRRTSARPPGCGCATCSRPATTAAPARPPTSTRAPGSAAPPATSPTSTPLAMEADARRSGSAGARAGSTCPAGRYDTILPPTAVADLMIDAYWYAGARDRPRGPVGLQPARRRHPDRRADRPRRASTCSPTRRTPGCECAPFAVAATSGNERSVFDNGLPLGAHRLDPRRRADLAAPDPALRRDDRPAGHAGDRQPGARRSTAPPATIDDLVAGTERGLLLTCLWYIREVDPQTPAAHRADPRRRLPGRERRDHRRGQQLPLQREPGRPAPPVHRTPRATVPSFSREWGDDYFSRTATPALRVPDFNMSSVSQAM